MKVKVWNDNKYPHTEKFNGVTIHLEPKQFIEMEEDEAVNFRGQFTSMPRDYDNQPIESGYKMIRIEYPAKKEAHTVTKHTCHACGKAYESPRMLEVHIDENHLDQLEDSEVAEKRRGVGRPKKEIAA